MKMKSIFSAHPKEELVIAKYHIPPSTSIEEHIPKVSCMKFLISSNLRLISTMSFFGFVSTGVKVYRATSFFFDVMEKIRHLLRGPSSSAREPLEVFFALLI